MSENEQKKLNKKQKAFCEYLIYQRMNQADAYLKAGFKAKEGESAAAAASRLLKNVNLKTYINELLEDVKAEIKSQLPDILDIIKANCNANLTDYMDINEGTISLKDWDSLPKKTLSAISEVQILREFKNADGKTGDIIKFKMNDKKPYIDLLMKYLEVINEKTSVGLPSEGGKPIDAKELIREWMKANNTTVEPE